MSVIFLLLKLSALFSVILLPLIPRKKKKPAKLSGLSSFAVNEFGYLETVNLDSNRQHKVY
jgi:hypothetical protein